MSRITCQLRHRAPIYTALADFAKKKTKVDAREGASSMHSCLGILKRPLVRHFQRKEEFQKSVTHFGSSGPTS